METGEQELGSSQNSDRATGTAPYTAQDVTCLLSLIGVLCDTENVTGR